MKNRLILLMLLFSSMAFADQVVTLDDGRKVILKDDFTWQYHIEKKHDVIAEQPTDSIPVVAPPKPATDIGTVLKVGSLKNTLQMSGSGVEVLLGQSKYESGELILPTSVTNQGSQDIIAINIQLIVHDRDGNKVYDGEVSVWKSIKRMADTYLRPKSAKEGRVIKLAIPKHKQYLISAAVTEVESR